MSKLACKLAQHSIFGEDNLKRCTPVGRGELPPLSREKMSQLKEILRDLFPIFRKNAIEYEEVWQDCILSIQHLCKRLRMK